MTWCVAEGPSPQPVARCPLHLLTPRFSRFSRAHQHGADRLLICAPVGLTCPRTYARLHSSVRCMGTPTPWRFASSSSSSSRPRLRSVVRMLRGFLFGKTRCASAVGGGLTAQAFCAGSCQVEERSRTAAGPVGAFPEFSQDSGSLPSWAVCTLIQASRGCGVACLRVLLVVGERTSPSAAVRSCESRRMAQRGNTAHCMRYGCGA
ncbi:hypothetical protein L226DRAFT_70542 [Lentinus tigrinus ALCF2SS1-7]|uniref:uncharacterized protein n=1 Tax=Lentinus tigrinus ALCF2SS1-7 TaxID=1328758 RepID=UPI00116636BF|nr:hypothetical protein L226DRAFT_70542 [Lentinus tigrinus ALCF2SS1-7]